MNQEPRDEQYSYTCIHIYAYKHAYRHAFILFYIEKYSRVNCQQSIRHDHQSIINDKHQKSKIVMNSYQ